MTLITLSINAALLAAILLILFGSPSQAAHVERRQDQCNPANDHLTIHDCAVLTFKAKTKSSEVQGPLTMRFKAAEIVDCRGGTEVYISDSH
ncbi:uncharacterized protein PGTG_11183 [Puccinia graminis f. sp. tritici CRL 75-36-700-3]|uniref:Uncharacterized protein n=1 Tax=Puccinia graminis f. sp. tritici (strain CRL 75-36-700-3 / race SCCL) TaxID=418459 RepID=E3KL39_PUCGT|nr:uncharacterized protein PGTG_11183 [Puccinia graminis f. sp. tritici CRL 75-36-700-3]EFP85014.2 hypothetical protein PGTG_11183 [Puccinia graminis f. sp. tritici CRL 75-36-700-3]